MASKALQWSLYPLTMCISVLFFFALFNVDEKHMWAVGVPLVFGVAVVLLNERYLPYKLSWKPVAKDLKNDGLYLLLVELVLPNIFIGLSALFILRFIKANDLVVLHIWPHHLPIAVQEIMVVLISDFLRYWMHRLSHTLPILWRLHAVHHSVDKMYWMNTARFHPIEKAMQFMLDVFPFMLLGISEEVILLHLVLYGVNGFFQHCNIDLKFGWLNYLVSTPELHRWHHSRKIEESNNNYGNNVIVWDILFGTHYWPKERTVAELGLINKNYPKDFGRQMKAPLISKLDKVDLPELTFLQWFLNLLLKLKLFLIKKTDYKTFMEGTLKCEQVQKELLLKIIHHNKNTHFGKEHQFEKIVSYEDYKKNVPVGNYESLSPYIKKQAANQATKALIEDEILMFNKTSGTTSEPKLIPVTKETLKGLKISQNLMVYQQYAVQPLAYHGKIVGIASPAVDSMSENNIPIGSASGHFYKNVSSVVESKYVVPYEVLEIKDYELKYYTILLFCLQHKDITYIATANPTTILKLAEILNTRKAELLRDLQSGSISGLTSESFPNLEKTLKKFKPRKSRIKEVEKIFASESKFSFREFWPYLKLISTWTGGSCGIALGSALALMPEGVSVIDLGYLSSEVRGTVTFDAHDQSGLTTFTNNFFEFVERQSFEHGEQEFLLLHQLELHKEYYIFITTPAGLFRYNMNDVISVSGFINDCPLIKFVQKGKGVCNITGEKLYESQVLNVMSKVQLDSVFVQMLANEEKTQYEFYLESSETNHTDAPALALQLDSLLCEENNEYKEKRASNRLKAITVYILKSGSFENIKKMAIQNGQSEGQYKTMLLQYKSKLSYNLENFVK